MKSLRIGNLRFEGRVQLVGEEEVVEILDGENERPRDLGEVEAGPELPDPLHDPLGVGVGGGAAVGLGEEPPELGGAHGGAALGVRRERLPHVARRLRLSPPELPREANAVFVAPHRPPFSSSVLRPPPMRIFSSFFFGLFFGDFLGRVLIGEKVVRGMFHGEVWNNKNEGVPHYRR